MSKYINAESLVRKLEGYKKSIVASHPLVTAVHESAMDFAIEVIENMPCLYADEAIQEAMKAVREKALDDFAEAVCEKANDNSIQIMIENLPADIITLDFVSEMAVDIAEQMKGGE
jgi:hypothetical protein